MRDIRISPEIAALAAGIAPDALRQFVDGAEGQEVYCAVSGRMLPEDVPVSVIAFRDPAAPATTVHLQYADARLHDSAVIERPGLRDLFPTAAGLASEREFTWFTLRTERLAGLAFQFWLRFYGTPAEGDDPGHQDLERIGLTRRGWAVVKEPAVLELPHDPAGRLTLAAGELVFELPDLSGPLQFELSEPLEPGWIEAARRRRRAIVLYGCGLPDRYPEAVQLGDVVGATVPFVDRTGRPPRRSRWRRRR